MCLFAGTPNGGVQLPKGLDEADAVDYVSQSAASQRRERAPRHSPKDRDWILRKKQLARKRGKDVPLDTKYTGRRRQNKSKSG